MRKYAVLIDAGFLRFRLGTATQPMQAEHVTQFIERLGQTPPLDAMLLHRAYYYDAPPLTSQVNMPLQGGKYNFAASDLARHNRSVLSRLSYAPMLALRLGELRFGGWRVKSHKFKGNATSVTVAAQDMKPVV